MFGREPMLSVDIEYGIKQEHQDTETYRYYIKKFRERLSYAFDTVKRHSKVAQKHQSKNYNKKLTGGQLGVGDTVLMGNKAVHYCDKLADNLSQEFVDSYT